ncbi:MAG: hypothetical protein B6245_03605 [Desulfobacteraceae bacterium 4572_88]|nr:MAG: hypothetical protein B6245_03605 [Desulfobacteraceae bacterium 4572_88]
MCHGRNHGSGANRLNAELLFCHGHTDASCRRICQPGGNGGDTESVTRMSDGDFDQDLSPECWKTAMNYKHRKLKYYLHVLRLKVRMGTVMRFCKRHAVSCPVRG